MRLRVVACCLNLYQHPTETTIVDGEAAAVELLVGGDGLIDAEATVEVPLEPLRQPDNTSSFRSNWRATVNVDHSVETRRFFDRERLWPSTRAKRRTPQFVAGRDGAQVRDAVRENGH